MAVRRVAILGAESSGKSTLAAALAVHYRTVWVPEYLREFVEKHARVPYESDQFRIAQVQMEREHAAAALADGWLFCDTTPFMTAIYSGVYWGRVDPLLCALDRLHNYAVTLVTAPDGPWVPDGLQRESAAVRQSVHEAVIDKLERRSIAYTLVTGSLEQRLPQAVRALEQHLLPARTNR
ncbi:nicotinamide-nucleotide adenylyltransferase [Massilia eurypsychrophila]|jgi:NadR type nicotinamide-nucleotide adenylyltransferase|uniref:Nicotinamide-nucleotide adenylyltransferase n=1 Tax=Massilia eurypsychrophila TaxID=1485217 RepID=A0A2G8TDV9_9BURK|nr:ATP-binding protein [Massilia eurypsychrophila]PIL44245.1 nicotinamide-nucleotide adenylyltransferase [Massilia eurypsychrophila]